MATMPDPLHFVRNFLDATPKNLNDELYGRVRSLLDAPDLKTAKLLYDQVVTDYIDTAPKAIRVLKIGFDDITAVLPLPEKYRKLLRTTNRMERLNEEIRRRERLIRVFPNQDSAIRLVGVLLMEMDEKWQTGHRYLDMTEYLAWKKGQEEAA